MLYREVTEMEVFGSLCFAIFHAMLEFLLLWVESKLYRTSLWHYLVICFNGRLNWAPFSNLLNSDEDFIKKQIETDKEYFDINF